MKAFWACVSAFALVLFVPVTASADVVENGVKKCGGSTPFSYVQHRVKGPTRAVVPPGSGVAYWSYNLGTSWTSGTRQGSPGGGYWEVLATTAIDNASTKGVCRSAG